VASAIPVLVLGGCNFHLSKMGCSIYHLECNFEENSDLKSVFEYLICYRSFSAGRGCKYDLARLGHSTYHFDSNFEENPDLKSVFEYLPCGICYGSFGVGGGDVGVISTSLKYHIWYIILPQF